MLVSTCQYSVRWCLMVGGAGWLIIANSGWQCFDSSLFVEAHCCNEVGQWPIIDSETVGHLLLHIDLCFFGVHISVPQEATPPSGHVCNYHAPLHWRNDTWNLKNVLRKIIYRARMQAFGPGLRRSVAAAATFSTVWSSKPVVFRMQLEWLTMINKTSIIYKADFILIITCELLHPFLSHQFYYI